jgi:hypothetical protein
VIYADTGFLLSLYLPETTTPAAVAALRRVALPVSLVHLGLLELRNALQLAVFRRTIREAERAAVWDRVTRDHDAGVLALSPVPTATLFEHAARLVDRHTAVTGARTLDIVHVAAALVLGASAMLTFDRRQRAVARAAGLTVRP